MKKLFSILLALTLALGMNAAFAESSPYAGGTGTAEDPYRIATAEQLLALSAAVNDGSAGGYYGACFALTEDLDLAGPHHLQYDLQFRLSHRWCRNLRHEPG